MAFQTSDAACPIEIPRDFVVGFTKLTAEELASGYRHGFLSASDARDIAPSVGEGSQRIVDALEGAPGRPYAELDRQTFGLGTSVPIALGEDRTARVWLPLALAWLYDTRDSFEDPFLCVEVLYAAFGHPQEVAPFVRYMPAPAGRPLGLDHVEAAWKDYVSTARLTYRLRST
jgi:hypothetical protein